MVIRFTYCKKKRKKNKSTHNILVLKIVKNNIFPIIAHKVMKFNIFFIPEEAKLDNWWKLVFNWKYFLFLEKLEPSPALKNDCGCCTSEGSISVITLIFAGSGFKPLLLKMLQRMWFGASCLTCFSVKTIVKTPVAGYISLESGPLPSGKHLGIFLSWGHVSGLPRGCWD